MKMDIVSEEAFGTPSISVSQPPDRLECLRLALWGYEQVNGPETVPTLILDSSGGVVLHTQDAGDVACFANADDAIDWLVTATVSYSVTEFVKEDLNFDLDA